MRALMIEFTSWTIKASRRTYEVEYSLQLKREGNKVNRGQMKPGRTSLIQKRFIERHLRLYKPHPLPLFPLLYDILPSICIHRRFFSIRVLYLLLVYLVLLNVLSYFHSPFPYVSYWSLAMLDSQPLTSAHLVGLCESGEAERNIVIVRHGKFHFHLYIYISEHVSASWLPSMSLMSLVCG